MIDAARTAMAARGWEVEFVATEPEGRTVGVARAAIDRGAAEVVVCLGGDGTFAEVARAILASERRPPLGLLPSGTANDQGKSFGIKAGAAALTDNLDIIAQKYIQNIDAGRIVCLGEAGEEVGAELFFDSAGWGLQPDILATRNRDREFTKTIPLLRDFYRDELVYAGAALKEYLNSYIEPTKFSAEVRADGERHVYEGLTDLLVSNTAVYAGEWVLDRLSDADDGVFELVPFLGRRELFSKAIRDLKDLPIWQEHLDALGVTHSPVVTAREFELRLLRRGREQIQTQIDGEQWLPGYWYRVQVLPRVLPLCVPKDWVAPWKLG